MNAQPTTRTTRLATRGTAKGLAVLHDNAQVKTVKSGKPLRPAALGQKTNAVVQDKDAKTAGKKPAVKPVALKKTTAASTKRALQDDAAPKAVKPTEKTIVTRRRSAAQKPEVAITAADDDENASQNTDDVQVESKPAVKRATSRAAAKPAAKPAAPLCDTSDPPVFDAPPPTKLVSKADRMSELVPAEHINKRVKTRDWDDLDAEDENDPLMVSEYVSEIMDYMRVLEVKTLPNKHFMNHQEGLSWKMRSILTDWIVEVHMKYRLLPETLYLAINIVDRFLSQRVVSVKKLQLVGVTAMMIASKYEEIVPPSLANFLYVCEKKQISEEEVINAELYMLQVLEYSLSYPSPYSFLRRCSKADNYDTHTRTLAKYLMEISLIDHKFIGIVPSKIAAAGLYLARLMLDRGEWDANLIHYSGYTEVELEECVSLMLAFIAGPLSTQFETLFKKYSARKYMKSAIFAQDWVHKHLGSAIMSEAVIVGEHELHETKLSDSPNNREIPQLARV